MSLNLKCIVVQMFLFSLLILSPLIAFAALVPCDGVQCSACDLVKLAQNILNFLVTITVLMGGVIFAIAGFKMVTSAGNAGKVSEAKDMFTNVIVGLLILLAAWLIVDTVMKVFVNQTSSGIGPWYQIQCVAQPEPTKKTTVPSAQTPTTGGLTHSSAVSQLGEVPVVSSGNCTDPKNKACTSLEGIQPKTIETVKNVAKSCTGCNLQISAGTEVGHTNACHTSGTCVDIKCAGGCNTSQINSIYESAKSSGATAIYETKDCGLRDALRSQGRTAYCSSDSGYGHITGDHASLYTQI